MPTVEAPVGRSSLKRRRSEPDDIRPLETYQVGADWYADWDCPHCGGQHTTLLKLSSPNPPGGRYSLRCDGRPVYFRVVGVIDALRDAIDRLAE